MNPTPEKDLGVGFFVGDRRSGKTKRMIEWAYGHPERVIVVHTQSTQLIVLRMAKEMKRTLNEDQVISYDKIRSDCLRGRDVVLGVDNIELLFGHHLFGIPVRMVTATGYMIN